MPKQTAKQRTSSKVVKGLFFKKSNGDQSNSNATKAIKPKARDKHLSNLNTAG